MGGETKGGGWGNPPSYKGRRPMEHSFQDAIYREDRARKNWVSAWGTMERGVAKKEVRDPGTYFATSFPVVTSALIGRTTYGQRRKKSADVKKWAQRQIANSETRRSLDNGWTTEAGLKVERGGPQPPPKDSIRSLGSDLPMNPAKTKAGSRRESGLPYPRGTRAASYNEPVTKPEIATTTIDFAEFLSGGKHASPTRTVRPGTGGDQSATSAAASRATTAEPPRLALLKTVPRTDPRVGYVSSIWAATGQGLAAAIPEVPRQPKPVRKIEENFSGWTPTGPVEFQRSESQVLSGVSKHRRKITEFNIFQDTELENCKPTMPRFTHRLGGPVCGQLSDWDIVALSGAAALCSTLRGAGAIVLYRSNFHVPIHTRHTIKPSVDGSTSSPASTINVRVGWRVRRAEATPPSSFNSVNLSKVYSPSARVTRMSGALKADAITEDATKLEFGEIFSKCFEGDDVTPLHISETKAILEMRMRDEESGGTDVGDGEGISETFHKTLQYCQRFGQFGDVAKNNGVRAILQESGLHPFEQAALANLCPADAEEAIALLPSLASELPRGKDSEDKSIPDETELGELIENLQGFRNFRDVEPETGAPTPHATLWRGRATFGSLGRGTGRVVCATSSQSWPINGALAAAARSATTGPVWRLALHHPRGSHRPGCHLATSVVHPRRLRSRVSRCVWVKAGVSFARGSRSWSPREVHGWPSELAAPRPKPTSP
eukprot:CAMPEP_0206307048 /NCGR_PEP_ID=MMETSP0106_2-20121207/11124_1 /ASSEMBLY_ACC=CAM_ASM_000206 /TAXON_ID=81532 /ORGANISM="Acanthoeca-like sp., Strain 10tr" /LENGTH=719 /DNA_ID=CAMNT_0053738007 /DNA_START=69 /DNA_END=2228 /DNA_ORIENTATION=-